MRAPGAILALAPFWLPQLSAEEPSALRSQSAISKQGRGGRRYASHPSTNVPQPYVSARHSATGFPLTLHGGRRSVRPFRTILIIRGHKVMLDVDLAAMYGVETKALVRAIKRNEERFPSDFMFQLSREEFDGLRYQLGTSKTRGGRRYLPYAFTEQGVAMLSSALRSPRAVQVNIEIMRAFVRLRELIATSKDLAHRLDELEKKYDSQFKIVFDAIRQLMVPAVKGRRSIGFRVEERRPRYRMRRLRGDGGLQAR
jgi:hypothetical protein